jgi:hypothetical protein
MYKKHNIQPTLYHGTSEALPEDDNDYEAHPASRLPTMRPMSMKPRRMQDSAGPSSSSQQLGYNRSTIHKGVLPYRALQPAASSLYEEREPANIYEKHNTLPTPYHADSKDFPENHEARLARYPANLNPKVRCGMQGGSGSFDPSSPQQGYDRSIVYNGEPYRGLPAAYEEREKHNIQHTPYHTASEVHPARRPIPEDPLGTQDSARFPSSSQHQGYDRSNAHPLQGNYGHYHTHDSDSPGPAHPLVHSPSHFLEVVRSSRLEHQRGGVSTWVAEALETIHEYPTGRLISVRASKVAYRIDERNGVPPHGGLQPAASGSHHANHRG